MPSRRRFSPQAVVVRERAVVDEAEVVAGRERMRPLGRDAALRRHARVAERMRPPEVLERERARELLRKPRLLVDLDDPARAHDPEVGPVLANPALGVGGVRVDDEDRVARAHRRLGAGPEGVAQAVAHRVPALVRVRRVQRQLARAARRGVAIDGDPAESGPRLDICTSIAARCSPRRSSTSGDFAKRPTIPHIWSVSPHGTMLVHAFAHQYGAFLHHARSGSGTRGSPTA